MIVTSWSELPNNYKSKKPRIHGKASNMVASHYSMGVPQERPEKLHLVEVL